MHLLSLQTSYQKLKNDFASDEVLLVALREQLSQRAAELAALRQHNAELSTRSMRLEADLAHEVQGATVRQEELVVVLQERDSLQAGLHRWEGLSHAGMRCHAPSYETAIWQA